MYEYINFWWVWHPESCQLFCYTHMSHKIPTKHHLSTQNKCQKLWMPLNINFSKRSVSCAVTCSVYEKLIKYKNGKKKPICYIDFLQLSALVVCIVISLLPYFKGWEQNMGLKWLVWCKLQTLIDVEYPCFLLYPS